MIVPDLKRSSVTKRRQDEAETTSKHESQPHSESPSDSPIEAVVHRTGKSRVFGRGTVFPRITACSGRTVPYRRNPGAGLLGRQDCPRGTAYYSCANGFKGCCSSDPCGPGGWCSSRPPPGGADTEDPSRRDSPAYPKTALLYTTWNPHTFTTPAHLPDAPGKFSTALGSTPLLPGGDDTSSSPLGISSPTTDSPSTSPLPLSSSSSSSSAPVSSPPTCPSANGTTYTDPSHIPYQIRCSTDTTSPVSSIIPVRKGGYGACFGPCSSSRDCAGFTYVGGERGGRCYLRTAMPVHEYEAADGRYVSCAKEDPSAFASDARTGPQGTAAGAIAGGVVAGVACVGLALLVIGFLARRGRRRRTTREGVEEIPIAVGAWEKGPHGAFVDDGDAGGLQSSIEPVHAYVCGSATQHRRAGSTGNDVFGWLGGSYDPPTPTRSRHTRQRSIYREDRNWV